MNRTTKNNIISKDKEIILASGATNNTTTTPNTTTTANATSPVYLAPSDCTQVQDVVLRLKHRDVDMRLSAAHELQSVVKTAVRQLPSEKFSRFMNELMPTLIALIQSHEPTDQLGGLEALDVLIDVSSEDDETKIIRFSNYLRNFFVQPHQSKASLEKAAQTLGHLARAGGAITADFVDFEVKRALEWLSQDYDDHRRRFSACLVLDELASNAPTLFYIHVPKFFVHIWVAVRDPSEDIRNAAAKALRSCLVLIKHRHTRHRVQWYCKIYEQVQAGFTSVKVEAIHGSLLIIGKLLQHTGEFMVPRFREVCNTVLKYKEHRERLVRQTVIQLLPRLAAFCPDAFVRSYLDTCIDYLIKSVTHDKGVSYLAIGNLSLAVGRHIIPQLDTIVRLAKDGMMLKRKSSKLTNEEPLRCVALLSQAVGDALIPYMDDLLDQMMMSKWVVDSSVCLVLNS